MDHPTDNLLRALPVPEAASLRSADDSGAGTLFGHFAVFDEWTEINSWYEGRFLERLDRSAFDATFAERGDSIRVLYDHGQDPSVGNKPLGVPTTLRSEKRGAYYEVDLFDTDYVRELTPAIRAGQMGASFRFKVTAEEWVEPKAASVHNPERLPERTIIGVDLYEFGPVTFPAYTSATAGMRSATDEFCDRLLHDPVFLARFTDRVGPTVVEHLIASLPGDLRSGEKPETPADGGDRVPQQTEAPSGRLVAVALADLRKRTR